MSEHEPTPDVGARLLPAMEAVSQDGARQCRVRPLAATNKIPPGPSRKSSDSSFAAAAKCKHMSPSSLRRLINKPGKRLSRLLFFGNLFCSADQFEAYFASPVARRG